MRLSPSTMHGTPSVSLFKTKNHCRVISMSDRRCGCPTAHGTPCRSKVPEGQERCWIHRGSQCSVCLGHLFHETSNRKLPCGHEFHSRCVERWKRSCQGDPTCPMCRSPFDLPKFRCKLLIERVPADGQPSVIEFTQSNISSIAEGFGIDFRTMFPQTGRMIAEILFDIDPNEDLQTVLRELGLPAVHNFD